MTIISPYANQLSIVVLYSFEFSLKVLLLRTLLSYRIFQPEGNLDNFVCASAVFFSPKIGFIVCCFESKVDALT